MFKGADYTNANPEDTAKTVAHYFRKSPEEVLAAMKTFKYFGAADWPEHMKAAYRADAVPGAMAVATTARFPTEPDVSKWENTSFVPKP